jgi:hypothetical protein
MRRRLSLLVLVAVFLFPLVAPASAADPVPPAASPAASADPSPSPAPPADPSPDSSVPPDSSGPPDPSASLEPSPSADPDPVPGADPSEPVVEPTTEPVADPAGAGPGSPRGTPRSDETRGRPDPSGRYIVLLASGADTATVVERHASRRGLEADRRFDRAFRGFAARLDSRQRLALLADPSVVAIVPDEVIELTAQTIPTGVSRIGGRKSTVASINGTDQRVDADVAIVDTGIQPDHPDLNVVGGYNCSTTDRSLWRDAMGTARMWRARSAPSTTRSVRSGSRRACACGP